MVISTQAVQYPDSDGQPMSDNTRQFRWIVYIKEGLDWLFADNPSVFVAGDLLWYPVEGDNKTRQAPDAMVVFGRPKGDRGSYRQWEEGDVAPQVVFEVLSPGNTVPEMSRKLLFYERFGVEEYYLYDPDRFDLAGFVRRDDRLDPVDAMQGWVSPRLGVRFALADNGDLVLVRPDSLPFESYQAVARRAEAERLQTQMAQQETQMARQEAEQAQQRAQVAEQRAEELTRRLQEMGLEP
ncbi:Uma2 family endonuclease [Gloeobacter violaceus]|nr:Uma2 family endonuclease [Gloeobacter violaceus]